MAGRTTINAMVPLLCSRRRTPRQVTLSNGSIVVYRSEGFKKFLVVIDKAVPKEPDVHLIPDDYGTHKTATIHKWLVRRERFHQHYMLTSASLPNMVERWFGKITRKQIKRGSHNGIRKLVDAVKDYLEVCNEGAKPFIWTKSSDAILESVQRYCIHTSVTGY